MRVMLDTNVLVSAILFQSEEMSKMLETIIKEHKLVLSSFVLDELKRVVSKKFGSKMPALDEFLANFSYELVYTPDNCQDGLFEIRDKMDYPVLYTAIIEDVDILVTGDKDIIGAEV